jgi:hypothetical protein
MLIVIPYVMSIAIILALATPFLIFVVPRIKNSKWLDKYVNAVEHEPIFTETHIETMKEIDEGKKELKRGSQELKQKAKQQERDAEKIDKFLGK